MKTLFLPFLFSFILFHAQSQVNPHIQKEASFGGTLDEDARSILQTTDGGYIFCGGTHSSTDDVSGYHGGYDAWVVKLNASGSIQWQRPYGGTSNEYAQKIAASNDGGYIFAGSALSTNGDVTGIHGKSDAWVVKINSTGDIEWQKCLGGSESDEADGIETTADGGYIVTGFTNSNDGDVSGSHGGTDGWVVKLDASGNIEWQKCIGGSMEEYTYGSKQTSDGGYITYGASGSSDGDLTNNYGDLDAWVVKMDASGNIVWQHSYGGSSSDVGSSIAQTDDGGYALNVNTTSNDGDVNGGNHGGRDAWLVKLSSTGNIQWHKCFGGSADDAFYDLKAVAGNSFLLAGSTTSFDGDVHGNHGGSDVWVVKISRPGTIQQSACFGGSQYEEAFSVAVTKDAALVFAGYSTSNDGDVSGHYGSTEYEDCWVVKTKPVNAAPQTYADNKNISVFPNPSYNGIFRADLGSEMKDVIIQVADKAGNNIYMQKLATAKQVNIDLNKMHKGIYYLTIECNGKKELTVLMIK